MYVWEMTNQEMKRATTRPLRSPVCPPDRPWQRDRRLNVTCGGLQPRGLVQERTPTDAASITSAIVTPASCRESKTLDETPKAGCHFRLRSVTAERK